ncbi:MULTISPECIES: glycosyltransferase [unclassified Microbacterium]|uniref:glycosyltransferase n=1 Tax=unclassified Microbacterium TaxID=2609290 RepID=UPI001F0FDD3D|nr:MULTISPECIES: glycosyltransferase [unclassified Microbacterium]
MTRGRESSDMIAVTIGIPTYRRPELLEALLLALPPRIAECGELGVEIDVLVVDNDAAGSAREVAERAGLPVRYVIEPTPGIAAARNRILDECEARDLVAFIDDDEIPREHWLSSLLTVWREHGADAVMGRVISIFDEDVDPWLLTSGTFRRPTRETGTVLEVAAAGNLLLDLRCIRRLGLRFDQSLGLGGGEDTLFSRQLVRRGGLIVWCNESETEDPVVAARLSRSWAAQRAFSSANANTRIELQLTEGALRRGALRVRAFLGGVVRIVAGVLRRAFGAVTSNIDHHARGTRIAHRGRGMVAAAFGRRYDEYSRPSEDDTTMTDPASTIRVMQSLGAPRPTTNPYNKMLDEALGSTEGLVHLRFSWKTALFGRYDAFHWHWPEAKLHGSSWWKSTGKYLLTTALVARHRLSRRIAVVRTVHNIELPDDNAPRLWLLRFIDRHTDYRILINETTPLPPGTPHSLILHGHYRDWYAKFPSAERVPGRLGSFGGVRRYKGLEGFIDAYAEAVETEPTLSLKIGGRPSTPELGDDLRARTAGLPGVELHLDFLSDAELVQLATSSELIVLAYRFMHNSGSVLAALSMARPVLVPRNEANEALAREVGPEWVLMYDGDLDASTVVEAWHAVSTLTGSPDLSRREWADAGRAHRDAFREAVVHKRRRD